jgi:ABC-type transporter MlaC component
MVRPQEEPKRIIDVKISLMWLISTTAAIVSSAAFVAINFNRQVDSLTLKMDAVLASNADLKQQMKERDAKYDQLVVRVFDMQRATDALGLRVDNLERRGK